MGHTLHRTSQKKQLNLEKKYFALAKVHALGILGDKQVQIR